jgi:hypothetical protein
MKNSQTVREHVTESDKSINVIAKNCAFWIPLAHSGSSNLLKLSLCLTKHRGTKISRGMEEYLHEFLTSVLDGGQLYLVKHTLLYRTHVSLGLSYMHFRVFKAEMKHRNGLHEGRRSAKK